MRIPALLIALLALSPAAHAIQTCELNGEHVNPANGHSTAGKTGLMRCKDADSGVLQREQELKDGRFIGLVRFYRNGVLEGRYERQASGVHRRVDEAGRLRSERHHDNRGRVMRERELDEAGQVTRDDAVFEDGSRKAFSR